ncbi:hypothetical protein B8W66_15900 [Mycobacterium decipiens]|uniref:Uncharacterized protein n=1 Tax=Mycobacterium decipiens TaxID=1430326 RepID=A0A1X2LSV9_9MYCO|nr:hypothetical protein B8W66_15900 [Mycobacterium decipiens]
MGLYCGIDWATDHHDVAVVDHDGRVVARSRVSNDAAGFAALLTLLADAGDNASDPIPVAIETDRALGRRRNLDRDTERLRQVFTATYLHQPPVAKNAMGIQLSALLRQFHAACIAADELAEAATAHFDQHPHATTITSFPGLGMPTGDRVLAEIGDDRSRFAEARGLKAFAGSAPITRASGKKTVVLHRHIKNRRLAAVRPIWALGSQRASPGARRHHDARRAAGDWNRQAQPHLFNKFLGQLHHCLHTGQLYDEHRALPPPLQLAA